MDISKLMNKHTELAFLLLIFHMFFVGFLIEIFFQNGKIQIFI